MSGSMKEPEGAASHIQRLAVISFSETGAAMAERTAEALSPMDVRLYGKYSRTGSKESRSESLSAWTASRMKEKDALLFIGATGIAVRAIAPHIVSKLSDSPVLVMDELGLHVIPLLSGHVGGANALALQIAEAVGAEPVITTATDLHGRFAVDVFAKENGLRIANKNGIAKVSSKVLRDGALTVCVQDGILASGRKEAVFGKADPCNAGADRGGTEAGSDGGERKEKEFKLISFPPAEPVDILIAKEDIPGMRAICLLPRPYVVGIGCRRDKDAENVEVFVTGYLASCGISWDEVSCIASVDIKKDEEGILALSRSHRVPFLFYPAEELAEVPGTFEESDFVKKTIGIGNVCERAALCAAGHRRAETETGCEGTNGNAVLVAPKKAENGVTCAVARWI